MNMPAPIGATGFIKGLPVDVRDKLLSRGQLRTFAKGQLIQQRGDRAREFWFVKSGYVQIGRYGVDGQLTLFALLGPTETFGELAFLGNFDRTVDAIAGSDAKLFRIGQAEFQSLIDADASAARLLLQTMAHTVQHAFNLVEAGRSQSVPQRLALALLQLDGGQGINADIRITQQELADLVGVSRVSLGKALKQMEREGFLECGYNNIRVSNRAAIEALTG